MTVTPAEAYEQFIVPAIFEPWARMVLRAHPPTTGSRVLDVACGTGIGARVAAALVGPTGQVAGVDTDPGMLAVAGRATRRDGDAPIVWHHATASALPFEAGEFDVVLCFEGLQFFPDRPAALREMRRVLRSGGVLVATVWGPLEHNPAYEALATGLRRFVSEDAARLTAFSMTDGATIRTLMQDTGFGELSVKLETLTFTAPSAEAFVDWVAAGAPSARHNLALLAPDQRQAFSEFVAARLTPFGSASGLSVPSTRHVIVARR
jgi:ubiquinone/menaquinone biosynthesis C-methylase UbiE